jgi:hypothetical protein
MDILRSFLLGTVVILSSVAVTNAAARKDVDVDATAPAPYGLCDLYGDAFFYRPGTRHCVRTSGLAFAARWRALLPAKSESGASLFADHAVWGEAAGSVYTTPLLFAYTAPLGDGFSTLALVPTSNAASSDQKTAGTQENSEIAGTIKLDEPWAAAPFQRVVPQTPSGSETNGGLQGNKEMITAGDKLWLQAAFDKGPQKHAADDNLNWAYGSLDSTKPSAPVSPEGFDFGWNAQLPTDCVYNGVTAASATCDKPWSASMSGAFKHYWAPDLSATVSGTSLSTDYDPKALEGFGGLTPGDTQESTPRGLDIGTQFMYLRLTQSSQAGHVADVTGTSPNAGIPANKPNPSENQAPGQNEGRIRVQRQF